jgi:hypothetical protein
MAALGPPLHPVIAANLKVEAKLRMLMLRKLRGGDIMPLQQNAAPGLVHALVCGTGQQGHNFAVAHH